MEASPALKAAVESVETLRASSKDARIPLADFSEADSATKASKAVARASDVAEKIARLERNGFPLVGFA